MKRIGLAVALTAIAVASGAQAQNSYAGLDTRPIKALSAEQISDLREGRGMGQALAAELNGYPGPSHVLELSDQLSLSEEQRTRVQTIFAAMKNEAIPLGEKLIVREAELDKSFAMRTVTTASLASSTRAIAELQGALRAAHLKYHLATVEILAPWQIERYSQLRGYDKQPAPLRQHHPH